MADKVVYENIMRGQGQEIIPLKAHDNGDGTFSLVGYGTGGGGALGLLTQAEFDAVMGPVQVIPTANTVLGRLRDLLTGTILAAGANMIGFVTPAVSGFTDIVAVEMIRVADTNIYAVGDIVSQSVVTTTPIVLPVGRAVNGTGYIVKVGLITDQVACVAAWRVRFYNVAAPTVVADNVAATLAYTDGASYLGYFDLPAMVLAHTQNITDRLPFRCITGTQNIVAVLQTQTIFTPASAQKFTLTVGVEQN